MILRLPVKEIDSMVLERDRESHFTEGNIGAKRDVRRHLFCGFLNARPQTSSDVDETVERFLC